MNIANIYQKFKECTTVSTDTRNIEPNSLFIALKGLNFDANTFTQDAVKKGAKYVIIDNEGFQIEGKTILVKNSLRTLQQLANHHRKVLNTKIIGLTGSNGKTTTKELINSVLSKKYKTIATIGNLNNHIGVPLTLLRLKEDTEIGIIEMGANHQKEIAFLCNIAQPDFGYITNFGKAHLEGFGGIKGVIKGKSELINYINEFEKVMFVNLDDPLQKEKCKQLNTYTFATKYNANIKISAIKADPMVTVQYDHNTVNSNLIGLYNANNINAAITIGKYFGVTDVDIKNAIEEYLPTNNRSQIIQKNSNKIILDAYNANPSSMEVTLSNFLHLKENNKIAILGDMFELGKESYDEHKKIVETQKSKTKIKHYFIGKEFYKHKNDIKHFNFFECYEDFKNSFKKEDIKEAFILIKGSRGMALEKSLELL